MGKYTAGPWRFSKADDLICGTGEDENIIVCRVAMYNKRLGKDNAKLLLAAPDLLEALQLYIAEHDAMLKAGELSKCLWARGKAERAIAKATGA